MKNLLYIGNNLKTPKSNLSTIQVLGKRLEQEGHSFRYASSYRNTGLRLVSMLWNCLRYSRWADAVLIDTYSTRNFYYALLCSQLCRLLGVPYLPILHGGNLPKRLKDYPKLSQLIFKYSYKNISPSLYMKDQFKDFGFDSDYIPNAIQLKNYEVVPKSLDSIRLLWVRSFSKIYNPEMAIHVLKALQDKGYPAELCMVGPDVDGSLKTVKTMAKEIGVFPTFTGKLSKAQWITLSKGYTIFINTANFDNMPVSVIEAMALGFPIVSTNVGGMPNLIEDGRYGFLVDKGDVNAMTNAILRIFEDNQLQQDFSAEARLKAESLDWNTIKLKWYQILKSV
ncbi:glycosyltransferase involved in cell wall biosynthesis [Winogradskyella wandonensis]|uniref:Glycosyltransferase involved in cell wall biosynthesis n=1 Tax=Winogradskyella wandonensis TaxID=1442586 RepID=A0A4V2PU22_9FLAO|nr:glycosyltransferase [Winogradskyella wandonensis]TCK68841.1 glycosyltransferase involved in cell wall biosynthesis [Winogradskyella wandonensis]